MIYTYDLTTNTIQSSLDDSTLTAQESEIASRNIMKRAQELGLGFYDDSDAKKKVVGGVLTDKTDDELYTDSVITLDELRQRKIQALHAKEASVIAAGFSYDVSVIASTATTTTTTKIFECNVSARQKLETLISYGTFPFDWLTHYEHGREPITMTKAEMTAFYQAMLAYITPIKQHLYTSESLLINGSANDVTGFDPNQGWP